MYNGRVTLRYAMSSSVSESSCSGPPGLTMFTVTPTGMVITARSMDDGRDPVEPPRLAMRLARFWPVNGHAARRARSSSCGGYERLKT